ncbi:MAG: crossover junction endodeoxyribonuclease RuvC [Melioribacteraceae bacterium]|nr:crossover junction endodeoxyribonuclease RuvC [Melioribacteraceae bacterium]
MTILGIDPGTICTGFGIISYNGNELTRVASGIISPPRIKELAPRLASIYDEINRLIKTYKPDYFVIETAFYDKNVQSAMKIGYARGVSLLAAHHNNIAYSEYSPREIKKSVVGNGAASKEQVQYMIKKLLCIKQNKMKFDESDALAAAVCHALKKSPSSKSVSNWKIYIKENPDRIIF